MCRTPRKESVIPCCGPRGAASWSAAPGRQEAHRRAVRQPLRTPDPAGSAPDDQRAAPLRLPQLDRRGSTEDGRGRRSGTRSTARLETPARATEGMVRDENRRLCRTIAANSEGPQAETEPSMQALEGGPERRALEIARPVPGRDQRLAGADVFQHNAALPVYRPTIDRKGHRRRGHLRWADGSRVGRLIGRPTVRVATQCRSSPTIKSGSSGTISIPPDTWPASCEQGAQFWTTDLSSNRFHSPAPGIPFQKLKKQVHHRRRPIVGHDPRPRRQPLAPRDAEGRAWMSIRGTKRQA